MARYLWMIRERKYQEITKMHEKCKTFAFAPHSNNSKKKKKKIHIKNTTKNL